MRCVRRAVFERDVEDETIFLDREAQAIGSAVGARGREVVLLEQIEDRDAALVLDVGAARRDRRLVEIDVDEAQARRVVARPSFVQPDADRARVRVEAFGVGERRGTAGRASLSASRVQPRIVVRFMKSSDAEARGEARRARGRQHVVRAADIVADGFRRVGAEEDRAGVADALGDRLRIGDAICTCSAAMRSASAGASSSVLHEDDRAVRSASSRARCSARGRTAQLAVDLGGDGAAEGFVVGDEDALRGFVVLGLREQVGRDPGRIVVRRRR